VKHWATHVPRETSALEPEAGEALAFGIKAAAYGVAGQGAYFRLFPQYGRKIADYTCRVANGVLAYLADVFLSRQ
jgi:hypothetical protein